VQHGEARVLLRKDMVLRIWHDERGLMQVDLLGEDAR
jgi:hypothetical protein